MARQITYPMKRHDGPPAMFRRRLISGIVCAACRCVDGYGAAANGAIAIDLDGPAPRSINAYQLFKDVARQLPNDGLMPYEINAPLFSDYAEKYRFLYMPPGQKATYDDQESFLFPVGSVLVKTFAYPNDRRDPAAGERIIETRLLIHRPKGWVGYPYIWNDDLSDARLAVAGAQVPVSWIHDDGMKREMIYTVPNMNQCNVCHRNNNTVAPIGPKARQLNRRINSSYGPVNQLAHWIEKEILWGAPGGPEAIPAMPPWDDPSASIEQRGRSYLDGNCAHCHRPGGDAGFRGLEFTWAYPKKMEDRAISSPTRPVISFCLPRLRATEPWRVMPRIGRTIPHDEGIALLEAWEGAIQGGLQPPMFRHSAR